MKFLLLAIMVFGTMYIIRHFADTTAVAATNEPELSKEACFAAGGSTFESGYVHNGYGGETKICTWENPEEQE